MFKLIAATLAALFAVLHIYGAPDRRVETTRVQTESPTAGLSFASFFGESPVETAPQKATSSISDAEAIKRALAASATARAEKDLSPLHGAVVAANATAQDAPNAADTESANFWYVTGTTVNLRQGPGTGNAVVGSLPLGTEAEILADQNGWYQIRTPDGRATGWIFGKFLAEQRPG